MLPRPAVPMKGSGNAHTRSGPHACGYSRGMAPPSEHMGLRHTPGNIALADNVGDADLAVIQRDAVHYRPRAAAARNRSARPQAAWLQAMVAS